MLNWLANEEHFRAVFDKLNEGIILFNTSGEVLYTNEEAKTLFGQVLGANLENFANTYQVYDLEGQLIPQKLWPHKRIIGGETVSNVELQLKHLDTNRKKVIRFSGHLLEGKTDSGILFLCDITEQKKLEHQFQRLLESPLDAMMVVDKQGIIRMINERMEVTFGYKREELLGKQMGMLVPQQFRSAHSQHHKDYFTKPQVRPMGTGLELYGLHKDGHDFPVEISLTPMETEGNMLVSAAIRDISTRKYAEILHARFGKILEASANEIYLFDANTLHFTFVNKGARDNLGYSMEELRELIPIDLNPEYTKETFAALIQPLRNEEKDVIRFTTKHRRKNGSLYPVEVNLQLYLHETPPIFVAIILDITERVRAETALRENEQRMALHIEHTPLAVIEWEVKNFIITAWNRSAERIFGYSAEEVIDKLKVDAIVPDLVGAQLELFRQGLPDHGNSYHTTKESLTKEGQTIICEWYTTQLKDREGKVIRVAALALDVTIRQRALEALLSAQEEERERISRDLHDQVGQSLTAINLGLSTMLKTNRSQLEQLKTLTVKTLEDVRRISHNLRPSLLNELGLEATLKRFVRELAEQCNLRIELLARLPERFDPNEELVVYRVIQEALTNIVRHAQAKNVSIVLTSMDNRLQLIVEDDGIGFEPNEIPATEKLGILGMRERVELLGGSLNIESRLGYGTSVNVRLPLRQLR